MDNFFNKIIFFIFISTINLFSNNKFYTISVCNDLNYENSLSCKDNLLKENKFDIIITKRKDTDYKTNYGMFNSMKEALSEMDKLSDNIKMLKPSLIEVDKNKTEYELYEFYSKKDIKNENFDKPKKIAYLTFDDGPILATKNILEIAKEEDIEISLFFIGYQIKNHPNIYNYALDHSKVEIINHTYSHANGKYQNFYINSDNVLADINKAHDLLNETKIEKGFKDTPSLRFAGRNVFRLPDISKNDIALTPEQTAKEIASYDKVFKEGYNVYGWDVEWEFEKTGRPISTPEQVFQYMEYAYKKNRSNKKDKVIVLMHDVMFNNYFNGKENLRTFIQLLKKNDWTFEVIGKY